MEMSRSVVSVVLIITIGVVIVFGPSPDRHRDEPPYPLVEGQTFSVPRLGTGSIRLLCWDSDPSHCLAVPPGQCATTHGVTLCIPPDAGVSPATTTKGSP